MHAQTFKTSPESMPDMGSMIYDTKTALVLRTDLAGWQIANVAAFLAGGLMAPIPTWWASPTSTAPAASIAPWCANRCSSTAARSTSCAAPTSARCRGRLRPAIYIEAMFKTANDADNRAAVAAAPADALDFVGIGVHGPRKVIDKVVNSLKFLS